MCNKWQPKVTIIKESHDLKTSDVLTMFEKLTENNHGLKKLEASEINMKTKEKVRENKRSISLKVSTLEAKVEEDDNNINDFSKQ